MEVACPNDSGWLRPCRRKHAASPPSGCFLISTVCFGTASPTTPSLASSTPGTRIWSDSSPIPGRAAHRAVEVWPDSVSKRARHVAQRTSSLGRALAVQVLPDRASCASVPGAARSFGYPVPRPPAGCSSGHPRKAPFTLPESLCSDPRADRARSRAVSLPLHPPSHPDQAALLRRAFLASSPGRRRCWGRRWSPGASAVDGGGEGRRRLGGTAKAAPGRLALGRPPRSGGHRGQRDETSP
jgi:hypothetical protein